MKTSETGKVRTAAMTDEVDLRHRPHSDPLTNGHAPRPQQPVTSSKRATLTAQDVDFTFLEPYILSGYRLPDQPWTYYLVSAFWFHNETLNVWTHAIGCLCIVTRTLVLVRDLGGLEDARAVPVLGFALACLLSNLLSSLAHLLHSRSLRHHYLLFFMDYAGITLYNLGNGIGAMYSCSHPPTFAWMEASFLPVAVTLGWGSFLACVLARLRFLGHFSLRRKVIMVSVLGAKAGFLAWPMVGRYQDCLQDARCSLSSLNHITVVFVFFALDGLCYLAHFPERCWPGRFDIWGHGHQWFHVCTVVTQQLQLRALHVDLVTLGRGHHAAGSLTGAGLLTAFLCLGVACWLTVAALTSAVDRKVERQRAAGDGGQAAAAPARR